MAFGLAEAADLVINLRLNDQASSVVAKFKTDLTTAMTVAGAAIGAMSIPLLRMGDEYHDVMETIRTTTGATGEELAGLEQSFRTVGGQMEHDLGLVAGVMSDLQVRTGLTGTDLEALTMRMIDFSDVTKTDAAANVALVTRVFGDWSVATEDQAETLDKLLRASQGTGLEVDRLMQTVVQFGAPLRLLGFGFEESIALLGKWEKEGVNVETMLQGLKFSVKTLAQEGVPAAEMADTLRQKIEGIGTSTDPVSEAIKLFGLRAGPDLAAAILEGRFSVDDLIDTIENGSETVDQAAKDTEKFGDVIGQLKNQVKLALGPITQDFAGLAEELGNAIYLLPALGGALGRGLATVWTKLGGSAAIKAAVAFAGAAAGTIYAGAAVVAEKFTSAISGMWSGLAGNTRITGSINSAGKLMGGTLGKALALGATAGLLLLLPEMWNNMQAEWAKVTASREKIEATKSVFLASFPTRAEVEAQLATLRDVPNHLDALQGGLFNIDAAGVQTTWRQQIADLEAYLASDMADAGAAGAEAYGTAAADAVRNFDLTTPFTSILGPLKAAGVQLGAEAGTASGRAVVDEYANEMSGGVPLAQRTANALITEPVESAGERAERIVSESAHAIGSNLVDALRGSKDNVKSAMDDLMYAIEHPMKLTRESARIEAALTSKNLLEGLSSKNPQIKAQAEQTKAYLINQWEILNGRAFPVASKTSQGYERGLSSQYPDIRADARGMVGDIGDIWDFSRQAGIWGWDVGSTYANKLEAALRAGYRSTKDAFLDYKVLMGTNSPPGLGNWAYGIGGWAEDTFGEWANKAVGTLVRAKGDVSGALVGIQRHLGTRIEGRASMTLAPMQTMPNPPPFRNGGGVWRGMGPVPVRVVNPTHVIMSAREANRELNRYRDVAFARIR